MEFACTRWQFSQVVSPPSTTTSRTFIHQEVWQHSPVSLETCDTPAGWKQQWHYTAEQVDYSIEQALRWHASTVNIEVHCDSA